MIGSTRWNATLALFGFLITFLLSLNSNLLSTSLIRGLLNGVLFFLLAYAFRWALGIVVNGFSIQNGSIDSSEKNATGPNAYEDYKGRSLDLTTPNEDDELNRLLKQQPIDNEPFKPLNPPKLSTIITDDPKQMVQAIRHMSDK